VAAWPRGRREAAAGGWTTGEAVAYPGPDGGRRLRRAGGWQQAKAPERRETTRRWLPNSESAVFLLNFDKFDRILTESHQTLIEL
jgi:hypothetical protein